jgi:hypothetical protein
MLTISGFHVPASFRRPSCNAPNTPRVASVVAFANFACTSWKLARGRLNCCLSMWLDSQIRPLRLYQLRALQTHLSNPYSLALAIQSSRLPMTPQLIPYLALFRQENGPFNPCTPGSIFSFGILTLSMKMDPVREARRASLFLIAGVSRPGVP